MSEITVTERLEKSAYITYLYNTLAEEIFRSGGKCELMFSDARTALRIHVDDREPLEDVLLDRLTEVIGIGYKYTFLGKKLNVSLPRREKRLMSAALRGRQDLYQAQIEGRGGVQHRRIL